jgi:type II secretion system protein H
MLLRSGKRGFTLIELMVTIAVFGILAAIAIPNFQTYMQQRRLNGAARQVMSDLMAARMKAVNENRGVRVFFFSNHQYRICDDADGNGTVSDGEGTVETKNVQTNYSDVTFSAVTANPSFSRNGTASGTTVTLTSPAGTQSVVVALTGRVRIE